MTYANPVWHGQIKPYTPRNKVAAAYRTEFDIGRTEDAKTFTICKIWCHAPTLEFPSISCFISFNNGSGSAYSRIKNVQELREIAAKLIEAADKLDPIVAGLEPQKQAIENTIKQYQDQMTMLEKMKGVQAVQDALNPPQVDYTDLQGEEEPPAEVIETARRQTRSRRA